MIDLRLRQIHLDFHTSEAITGIGSEFNPEAFAQTMKEAGVDSVTCFSRCHHGWIYHPTKFPYRHPELGSRELLLEQIEALHHLDIQAPIYITVGWDHLMASLHPEWCEMDENGQRVGRRPFSDEGGWVNMDFASEYIDYVVEQTTEIGQMLGSDLDGVFFDIIFQQGVSSEACLKRFSKLGWDPRVEENRKAMRRLLVKETIERLTEAVKSCRPEARVFHNNGHVSPAFRPVLSNFSHLEVESLPTGGWGYMHFPMTARYARTLGKSFIGMTGKFSETWGHFGSYKNVSALEFECFHSLALGGGCSVGDQLHPVGRLDPETYRRIGKVYNAIAEVEPWCKGAKHIAEIAVLNSELYESNTERMDPCNLGALRMLVESHLPFDFIDEETDLASYKIVVLSEVVRLNQKFHEKLISYAKAGGKIVAFGKSILNEESDVWPIFHSLVKSSDGALEKNPPYVRTNDLADTDFVIYASGFKLNAAESAEVSAKFVEPYFSRSWDRFCSHAHAPANKLSEWPAIVKNDQMTIFASGLLSSYAKHSVTEYRSWFTAEVHRLMPSPIIKLEGFTSIIAEMTKIGNDHVLHLLNYIPERRGLTHDIVEEGQWTPPLKISVRAACSKAKLLPSQEPLEIETEGEYTVISLPAFQGKLMVALDR